MSLRETSIALFPPAKRSRVARALRDRPYVTLVAACLAAGALSLLVLPLASGADAWAWSLWGREVLSLELDPTNGPSWKPLPVVFTTPLALLGEAAPALWAVIARAGALLLLAVAFRVARRLAGPVAGAFAVLALLATDLADYAASADSEPLTAALLLWAFERHLERRRGHALALLAIAALGRPEASPLTGLYAGFLWVREPRLRAAAAAAVALAPALWLGPPWLATGDPLSAGERANRLTEASLAAAEVPALAVLGLAAGLVALPVLAAAGFAVVTALAAARGRLRLQEARPTRWLAAAACAWVAMVAVLTQAGFTGNERYLVPAMASVCVLGGVGAEAIARTLGGRNRARTSLVVLALLALAAPFGLARVRNLAGFRTEALERARVIAGLEPVVARAGGRGGVLACGGAAVTRPGTQGTLAWELDLPLSAVERPWPPDPRLEIRPPTVVFSRAERRFDLLAQKEDLIAPGLEPAPLTSRVGGWRVFVVAAAGAEGAAAVAERCRPSARAEVSAVPAR